MSEIPARRIKHSHGTLKSAVMLPNGLRRVRTWYGWIYVRPDGSEHSRQYR